MGSTSCTAHRVQFRRALLLLPFDDKWFYYEKHAPAAYPSYPQMSSTPSTAHLGIFHDVPHLHTFDDKTVHRIGDVQTCGFDFFENNSYPQG